MDINILYFLSRLYSLCKDFSDTDKDLSCLFTEMLKNTDCDIVSQIPEDIRLQADELCEEFSEEKRDALLGALLSYKQECDSFLPDLSAENEEFISLLKEDFCENGYFLKDGIFRKVKGNHLYILECELACAFIADDFGRVLKVRVAPIVRIADAPIKKSKDGVVTLKKSGIRDNGATVADAKLYEPKAFYKNLRHLEFAEFEIGEEISISEETKAKIANSCLVASAVCENRAIPRYYKKLCKNDFPFGRAFSLSLWSSVGFYVLATLFIGFVCGLVAWLILGDGFRKIWGLFENPYYYIFTALISVIYMIITFKKIRSGRY